ncbi:MAG TPA: RodZ domain-containing protein [Burkholderiales bacterium]|nr:RodZ domain-containing protein [Burkholderiales bacterium]
MTESTPSGAAEEAAVPVEPQISIGAELRAARERQGLAVVDVAQRLKFAARQVEALEADNMAALPGLTFVRGFLRSYARLLGLDADALVGALERAAARDAGPSTVQLQSLSATPQPFPMRSSSSGSAWPWIIGMVVAVVGLGGFTLYQWQAPASVSEPAPATSSVASPNTTPTATPDAAPAPGVAASAAPAVAAVEPVVVPAVPGNGAPVTLATTPTIAAPPAPASAQESGHGKIHLVFSDQSWTEIRAAGGQVVYSQNNAAGSDAWVDGTPPFDFVIGNARAVKLYYRGSEVDLAPYIKVSVARMQLK